MSRLSSKPISKQVPKTPVFSYRSSRSTPDRPLQRQPQSPLASGAGRSNRSSHWHQLPGRLALIAIIVSGVYMLWVDINPKITTSGNDGQLLHSSEVYQAAARKTLSRSIFNRNKITLNARGLEIELKRQFPELTEVLTNLPIVGHRPVVELVAAQPVLDISLNHQLYVVDSGGRAIALASELSKQKVAKLPMVVDEANTDVSLGRGVITRAQVSFIVGILAELGAKQLQVQSLQLPVAVNELDVKISGLPYIIKFNTDNDARTSAGTYLAVKQKLETDHVNPVEYVDVRIEEKAYFK